MHKKVTNESIWDRYMDLILLIISTQCGIKSTKIVSESFRLELTWTKCAKAVVNHVLRMSHCIFSLKIMHNNVL